jgi:dihydroxyacetone kinase DhaKLM complex PTS-EIIA-like component DhaM
MTPILLGRMKRYYFHIRMNGGMQRDADGSTFPDDEAAIREAQHAADEMIAFCLTNHEMIPKKCLELVDEHGRCLARIDLRPKRSDE